ncbi:hypothetical protein Celaphus_00016362, partial [Cervus elaphus hippelaphus]
MFNIIDMRNGSSNPLNWNTSKNGDWHLEANTSTLYYLVSGKNDLHQSQSISGTLDPDVKDLIAVFSRIAFLCILRQENQFPGSDQPHITYGRIILFGNHLEKIIIPYLTQEQMLLFLKGGRLIGGWEDNPFKGELQIVLRGNHSTPEWALPEGPNQGSKVLAERYHVPGTSQSYTLAADVGILSRNIKILGEDYPGWLKESFGARVLVSSFTENMVTFKGVFGELDLHGIPHSIYKTKLSETAEAGSKVLSLMDAVDWQEGEEIVITTTSYDFHQMETRSIVKVLHDHKILILNDTLSYTHFGNARISNVEFYHSGQEGFRDSTDPRYAVTFLNLGQIQERGSSYVRGCAFHSAFSPAIGVFGTDGLDIDDNVIHFTINKGTNTVLQNNVVAGFAKAGYRIDGELCSSQSNSLEKWFDNEAHGGLFGIYMNQDGLPGCSLIQGFTIWSCWDYGIYFQTTESVHIYNVTLIDNGMAIFSMIYMPSAVSHKISSKRVQIKNSLIVGSSPEFNCSDVLTNDDPNIELSAAHRSSRPPSGGRSGICWPTFSSAHNMAPRKPHAGIMSYNSISDTTFVGFKNVCSGETNVIFITNPLNEDLQHPIHVKNIQLVDTTEHSKVFIHRPDLSKVNPSDCVDMVCDAKRKSLLKDMDGSFLGNSGSVIPEAEYEWNGNSQFGIGDYRIPKVMLTFPNGRIIRDSTCKYISEWQGYRCFGMEYAMMVIESLDSDTETRRLSPVAI